jgi:hypothetical protein
MVVGIDLNIDFSTATGMASRLRSDCVGIDNLAADSCLLERCSANVSHAT